MASSDYVPDNSSTSVVMRLKTTGETVDINNIPGVKKLSLIESGEVGVDNFITPPNCPGRILKELRDRHRADFFQSAKVGRAILEKATKKGNKDKKHKKEKSVATVEDDTKKTNIVMYLDRQTEVYKTRMKDDKEQYLLLNPANKKVWVDATKTTPVDLNDPNVEGSENEQNEE